MQCLSTAFGSIFPNPIPATVLKHAPNQSRSLKLTKATKTKPITHQNRSSQLRVPASSHVSPIDLENGVACHSLLRLVVKWLGFSPHSPVEQQVKFDEVSKPRLSLEKSENMRSDYSCQKTQQKVGVTAPSPGSQNAP